MTSTDLSLSSLSNDELDAKLDGAIQDDHKSVVERLLAERSRRIRARQNEIAESEAEWLAELDREIEDAREAERRQHHADLVAKYTGLETKVGTFDTRIRIRGRWHGISRSVIVSSTLRSAHGRDGYALTDYCHASKKHIVRVYRLGRLVQTVRCKDEWSAFKKMTHAAG